MVTVSDFGLKPDPFRLMATERSAEHWAGMPETKRMLQDIVVSVLPEDIGASEFVIISGAWGGGKTHALRYFFREIREQGYGYAFFASKVRLGAKPTFHGLFHSLIWENRDMLPELAKKVAEAVKQEEIATRARAEHASMVDDELRQEIIRSKVAKANQDLVTALIKVEPTVDAILPLFTGKGVSSDDYSAAGLMAALIGVMTSPIGEQPPPYKAAYVFLDEMEDMLNLKYADLFAFWGACRELINRTAESHCAVLFTFTIQTVAQLEGQIEPFLMERLTRPVLEIKQLEDEDAKEFVREFLQSVREDGKEVPQPFFPFAEATIDLIVERYPEIVPRYIIRDMGRIFERAVRRERVAPGEEISREVAEEILNEMGV